MRVSRVQAEQNRQTVIEVASRLFREHGFGGIGLKDLMKTAGLTQGGFYKQFSSKEDLAIQASQLAFESTRVRWSTAGTGSSQPSLESLTRYYLSPEHRDEVGEGCPMVALGADAARQGPDIKKQFEEGLLDRLEMLDAVVTGATAEERRKKCLALLATMTGAVLISRAVGDDALSCEILEAAADQALKANG
jgi:TetR/AcrR family transcriptional repressor of nem operon